MADFSIIADTSNTLLRLLRDNLSPDPIQSPESIALVSPNDKNGDFQLGAHLYDIRELSEYRSTVPINGPENTRTRPAKPLSLSYLLFLNTKAQIAAGAEMEQRIFGRAIQVLMDNSVLNLTATNPFIAEAEEETGISLVNITFEDKTKIWTALSAPYQVAVYFTVSPVLLSSRREQKIVRTAQGVFSASIITPAGARGGDAD